jgi:hypothetical protein
MNPGRLVPRALGVALAAALVSVATVARAQDRAQEPSLFTSERYSVKDYGVSLGMRAGLFIPSGGLYADRNLVTTTFRDIATAGPALEFDLGARFARHFVGYALFEQAFLGRGSSTAWTLPHGGQSSPATQAAGIGMRWESNPAGWGAIADVALAYRWLTARWTDSTSVRMRGLGEVRLGFGMSWRVSGRVALAPMVTLLTGTFTDRTLDGRPLGDMTSSYAAATVALSGQADL